MTGIGNQTWWRSRGMSLEALVSFLAVVEFEGFGRAAEALHRSQSRVSTHVAELERILGTELFDRRQRPTRLTDTGAAFAEHARVALGQLESGAAHVQALMDVEEGEVRIGSYASASIGFLPGVLADFTGSHPKMRVVLHETHVWELETAVLEGDVGLAIRPVQPGKLHPDIEEQPLWREDMKVVLPESHPAAATVGTVPAKELLIGRVISVGNARKPGQMWSAELDTDVVLRMADVDVSRVIYTQHPQALVAMVRAGLGVGVVNGLALATSDPRGVVSLPVLESKVFRDVALCWHRERYHSAAERRLISLIQQAPPPPGAKPLQPDDGGATAPWRRAGPGVVRGE